jgi:hypothetical protein
MAQISDRTETNCNAESRSIYEVGAAGRPLIVASKGLDCSICMNSAPAVGAFAESYAGQIEVWGAMANRYNPADPTCEGVAAWESNYDWTNIFTFLDLEEYWFGIGFPTYHVIHPETHEVVYQGGNWNTASNTAISLLESLSANDLQALFPLATVHAINDEIYVQIQDRVAGAVDLEVFNIAGQLLVRETVRNIDGQLNIHFPFTGQSGIYFLRIGHKGQQASLKFFVGK